MGRAAVPRGAPLLPPRKKDAAPLMGRAAVPRWGWQRVPDRLEGGVPWAVPRYRDGGGLMKAPGCPPQREGGGLMKAPGCPPQREGGGLMKAPGCLPRTWPC